LDQQYPRSNPHISVSATLLTRTQNDVFAKELRDFVGGIEDSENKILSVIDFAKEKYDSFKIEHRKEFEIVEEEIEVLIVKIDHMRNSSNYVKTLEDWTEQFALTGALIISKQDGIVLMMEGEKYGVSKFIQNWKSVNIDVDSRGKPCKEKMIQILFRGKTDNLLLAPILEEKFSFLKIDSLSDYFSGHKILDIINDLFYS